jgi:hypothetical protein
MTTPKDYCTIEDVKASMSLTGTQDDDALQAAVTAASRLIDHHCERYFYQDDAATARVFVAESILAVECDDFDPTQTIVVKTDPVGLRTWDQTWTSADYQMEPLNGMRYGMPWPCNRLRAIRSLYFPVWGGAAVSVRNVVPQVQITAKWGWAQVPDAIFQAAVIQAAATFQAIKAPLGATSFGEAGIVRVKNQLHPHAQLLIQPYSLEDVFVL